MGGPLLLGKREAYATYLASGSWAALQDCREVSLGYLELLGSLQTSAVRSVSLTNQEIYQ